ncbi:hypothetical protein O159_15570 [Leifsonia xyli subsp. cynodontis DSM 46306]|uniref:DUF6993 domain-containing protein n=1 Tax=Leifsonia xyli subsp. cynodontis DSM 46306 TaxID=1389489 RepID=U3PDI5_LEIXC|nr:hypothetical protein [Leifsonia xyli]AGW41608.1 hypothetical protein O159_15570 [Leifsonia xyli subsp. cynodontis DSM 46306]
MTRPTALTRTAVVSAALALGLSVLLAGCTPQPASPPSASPTGSAGQGVTPAPSAAPTLVPGGTAQQNLPFFDHVNQATLAANPEAKGRDFIDALVAAGFAKADMQVTVDTTTIGLKANSIQFSVKLGDSCLIGQNGADAGGYNSTVAAPIPPTGTCLVGQTRAIDW